MAFTEAELNTQLSADGLGCEVLKFVPVAANSTTDVYVQNVNKTSSVKTGWVNVAQSNTAAQAAALIRAGLTR